MVTLDSNWENLSIDPGARVAVQLRCIAMSLDGSFEKRAKAWWWSIRVTPVKTVVAALFGLLKIF